VTAVHEASDMPVVKLKMGGDGVLRITASVLASG
jgi:hypothetical protein